jgi:pSer/pThr/pTyr-binding forkhead associated (FHA) protein
MPYNMGSKLVIRQNGLADVAYPLITSEILIGRLDSVDLVIEDPAVSRVHAKIMRTGARSILVDLESTIGTMVNGTVVDRHCLHNGDIIQIATTTLEYRE